MSKIGAPKITIGLLGKTNVGKSTFFSAATLVPVPIENRPFVTLEPHTGIAYARRTCVHVELGLLKCTPISSLCVRGERFIPVALVDIPGLVKDASKGRGLGNRFLDSIRQADVLIHVVDVSGSTDEDGRYVKPGYRDPYEDIVTIENEYEAWVYGIISRDWTRFARTLDQMNVGQIIDSLTQRLSGLSIKREHVAKTLAVTRLESAKPSSWREEELKQFVRTLRVFAKPIVIAANKIDVPEARDILNSVVKRLPDRIIVPVTALGELILRKAAEKKLIDYLPGDQDFKILDKSGLTQQQIKALELVRESMKIYGGTGVQKTINEAVFKALNMIVVYPVEDINNFSDSKGNILPDAYLVPKGTTALDLAYMVHTDLGKHFIYAVDAKSKQRVGKEYVLPDNAVIRVVASV
ncbi:MAG: redox-regulated ATPase YchF [Ignisphaera sp.]